MKEIVKQYPNDVYIEVKKLKLGMPTKFYLVDWSNDFFQLVANKDQEYQFSCISDTSTFCSTFNAHKSYIDAINEVYINEFNDVIKLYEFDTAIELMQYVIKRINQ